MNMKKYIGKKEKVDCKHIVAPKSYWLGTPLGKCKNPLCRLHHQRIRET